MTFALLYRASFYLMLFFATLSLNVDASDSKIAWLFPPGVALVAVFAILTVDRNPRVGLARPMAYGLLAACAGLSILEYRAEENLLLALAHFLVYLQVIKLLLPKTVEDDWLLFGLGVMQVLVGTVVSQSDREGMMLIIWALLALWVLGLFYLHRESLLARAERGTAFGGGGADDEPYPGLLTIGFLLSALRVMATTLALGGAIFLVLPRQAANVRAQGIESTAKHMTGFDEEVQLGQLGEILESDRIVMSVEFYDPRGGSVRPAEDTLYWRGVTMEMYQEGRWHRPQTRRYPTFPAPTIRPVGQSLRQVIKLEPTDSDVLFGLRPMFDAHALGRRSASIELNPDNGTIRRQFPSQAPYDYVVVSGLDENQPQLNEDRPGPKRERALLRVPDDIRPRLQAIAGDVLRREAIESGDVLGRARALETYLRDSGQFGYTLHLGVVDPQLDPVVDFLINRKEGHCEYFASALTLLLRSEGIPARMVNGFKGGDWTALTQVLSVRQKHAHSWVEALVPGNGPDEPPRWVRLDATPGTERAHSVAQIGGLGRGFRQVTDTIRYLWVFYVVGFNVERQRTLLQPIRALILEARQGFALMGRWLGGALKRLLTFQNPGQFFSPRGFAVSFLGLSLLVIVYRCTWTFAARVLRWVRGPQRDAALLPAGVLFYRRLAALLAEYGLERPPAETPCEFARRANLYLAGRGAGTQSVADVPGLVVDAFYHVRFGHCDLAPDDLSRVERSLDALERQLHAVED
jgi:transglutaminase-like putative cysteine protease